MPCILKIRVVEARDLPVMDRSSELTDAYVELKYADSEPQRTEVCRKTLNPHWNEDFRFEVPNDSLLQDEPLELKVFDYDIVSANDIIGVVYIDLNGLLMEDSTGQVSGWFPIYDNLRGIRGYLFVVTKLESFLDENPFKDASAGVQFFSVDTPFSVYRISQIYGFVEELIVEDDPEHHWSDTFRASRISNYERQLLLYQLSGRLRRQLGCKVLELGGNSVLGYRQHFDLEGDSGIVVRGYGTACRLKKLKFDAITNASAAKNNEEEDDGVGDNEDTHTNPTAGGLLASTGHEKSSRNASPTLSPKSSSITRPTTPPQPSATPPTTSALLDPVATTVPDEVAEGVDLPTTTPQARPDVQLLTLSSFQANLVVHIGGVVSARSVKILSTRRSDMREIRDAWWVEIRNEIKAHARSLGCPHVVGYTETTSIQPDDDLCVLSATGTAAVLDLHGYKMPKWKPVDKGDDTLNASTDESRHGIRLKPSRRLGTTPSENITNPARHHSLGHAAPSHSTRRTGTPRVRKPRPACSFMHIPYSYTDAPFPMRLVACMMCRCKYVPEILLATIEPPPGLPITGRGLLIEARVCRTKKRVQGEANATIVSDAIPFLEYHLHRQLLYKMKVLGMNAVFGLRLQTIIGESQIVGIATATAVFVPALPPPPVLHINRRFDVEDQSILNIQHRIEKLSRLNATSLQHAASMQQPDTFARYFPDAPSPHIPLPSGQSRRLRGQRGSHKKSNKEVSQREKKKGDGDTPSGSDEDGYSISLSSSSFTDSDKESTETDSDDSTKVSRRRKNKPKEIKKYKDTDDNSDSAPRNPKTLGESLLAPMVHGDSESGSDHGSPEHPDDRAKETLKHKRLRKKQNKSKSTKEDYSSSNSDLSDDEAEALAIKKTTESAYIVEVDDELDEDTMAVLLDPVLPAGFSLCNTESLPGAFRSIANLQFVTVLRRVEWDASSGHLNQKLSALFHHLYASIVFKLRDLAPCCITALRVDVQLPEENQVQLLATAMCVTEDANPPQVTAITPAVPPLQTQTNPELHEPSLPRAVQYKEDQTELLFDMSPPISPSKLKASAVDMAAMLPKAPHQVETNATSPGDKHHVELTPLSFLPGVRMDRYVGHIHIHFIKESFAVREDGGLGSFTHVFLTEANALARSHVAALGGNALVGFKIETFIIVENSAKDQAYTLISLSGDAYHVKSQPPQFRKNLPTL